MNQQLLFWIVPVASVTALCFAWYFYRQMMKESEGTPRMVQIAEAVRQGAMSYLKQQYKVVGYVFAVLVLLFSIMAYGFGVQNAWVPVAFLTGGFFSGLGVHFSDACGSNRIVVFGLNFRSMNFSAPIPMISDRSSRSSGSGAPFQFCGRLRAVRLGGFRRNLHVGYLPARRREVVGGRHILRLPHAVRKFRRKGSCEEQLFEPVRPAFRIV